MKRHTRLTAIGLVLTTGALAGCSSDDTLTQTEFVDQANAICIAADAEIGAVVGPVFEGDPTPDDLRGALEAIVATSRDTHDQLAGLAPPPAMADDVGDMLAAFATANDEAEAQGLGFFDDEGDPWAPVAEIADRLGIDSCGGG